jgi:ribosomal protein S27AE
MLSRETCSAPDIQRARLPACPQCGDRVLAPILAEHISPRHVRNHWACESCGHTFRESFSLPRRQTDVAA